MKGQAMAGIGQNDRTPRYGISNVSEQTGISAYTLRYYDSCGFFPDLWRSPGGTRKFSDADLTQLTLVHSLRQSGLSIDGIRYVVRLQKHADHGTQEISSIIKRQIDVLEMRIAETNQCLEHLQTLSKRYPDGSYDR
jgi:DNA-binding transcriptional MerR regulator